MEITKELVRAAYLKHRKAGEGTGEGSAWNLTLDELAPPYRADMPGEEAEAHRKVTALLQEVFDEVEPEEFRARMARGAPAQASSDSESLAVLESRVARANALLSKILPALRALPIPSEMRAAVEEAARLTHWKREPAPDDWWAAAAARAERLAKESGRPHLVLRSEHNWARVVIMPRSRFEEDGPFGLGEDDILYETGKGVKAKA